MRVAGAPFPCHDLDGLLVEDDPADLRVTGFEQPRGIAIFLQHAVEKPRLVGEAVNQPHGTERHDAAIDQRRLARIRASWLNVSHFGHLDTRTRLLLNVALEVAAMIPRVYEQAVAALVDVYQRYDIRPPVAADRGDVRHF